MEQLPYSTLIPGEYYLFVCPSVCYSATKKILAMLGTSSETTVLSLQPHSLEFRAPYI